MEKGEGKRNGGNLVLWGNDPKYDNFTIFQIFKIFPSYDHVEFRDYERMTVRVTQDQNLRKSKFKIRNNKNGNRK